MVKILYEALPNGNAPCGRGATAVQENALHNGNRFPSGATIDKSRRTPKSSPNHRVNEWLSGQRGFAIARFTLPLDNGDSKIVNLTYEQPLVMVCGRVGCGKSTTALILACQALAASDARLFFVTAKPAGWPPVAWDTLSKDFPGRCFEVSDVHDLDLAQISPNPGDIVILDERFHGARDQSLQRLIEQARNWRVGLFVCKQGGPADMEFELTKSRYPESGITLVVEGKGGTICHGRHGTYTATAYEPAKVTGDADRKSWAGQFTITVAKQPPNLTPPF